MRKSKFFDKHRNVLFFFYKSAKFPHTFERQCTSTAIVQRQETTISLSIGFSIAASLRNSIVPRFRNPAYRRFFYSKNNLKNTVSSVIFPQRLSAQLVFLGKLSILLSQSLPRASLAGIKKENEEREMEANEMKFSSLGLCMMKLRRWMQEEGVQ